MQHLKGAAAGTARPPKRNRSWAKGSLLEAPVSHHDRRFLFPGQIVPKIPLITEHDTDTKPIYKLISMEEMTMDYRGDYFTCRLMKMVSNARLRLPAIFAAALLLTLFICSMPVPEAAAKNFSSLPDMSTTRYGHSMTLLQNGTVLIAGGFNNNDCLKTAEIYDPETGQIAPARDMKAARMDHTATLLANGKVLITGGRNGAAAVNSAEIYDPSTNAFKATAENVA